MHRDFTYIYNFLICVGIILQTIYLQRIILIWMLFRNVTFTYALLALITYHVYVVC